MRKFNFFLTLILIPFLTPYTVLAINCKNARIDWEIKVCNSKILFNLDKELNNEYSACSQMRKLLNLKDDQKFWLERLNQIKGVSLIEMYNERLDQLKLCTGKLKLTYNKRASTSIESNKNDKNSVPFEWQEIKLRNKTILEYPQIVEDQNQPSQYITAINNEIKNDTKDLLTTSLELTGEGPAFGRPGISYGNYIFIVIANNSKIFGIEIHDIANGCLGGCTHPGDNNGIMKTKIWDLENGKAIIMNSMIEIIPGKENDFWKTILDNDKERFNDNEYTLDKLIENSNAAALVVNSDGDLEVSPCLEPATRFSCNYITEIIPISKVKAMIKLRKSFSELAPRLAKAGLIPKNFMTNLTS